jgi:hypothetical protein
MPLSIFNYNTISLKKQAYLHKFMQIGFFVFVKKFLRCEKFLFSSGKCALGEFIFIRTGKQGASLDAKTSKMHRKENF